MDNLPASPIEDINSAIQADNPFNAGIVKKQNVWRQDFPDLTSLNQIASDTILQALAKVKTSEKSHEKVTSLAITAPAGVGKTHIMSRIRHHLKREGGGLFIYASVDKYGDLNLIKYNFQQSLVESLTYPGSQGVMQWQEVAASLANDGFQALSPKNKRQSPAQLIKNFDKAYQQLLKKKQNLIDILQKEILKSQPQAKPYIVRAILWLLSKSKAPFALEWLSGQTLYSSTADEMGLPTNSNKTDQQKENDALNVILQVLNLVTIYKPVIICFDEFESVQINDAGFTSPLVVADLVRTLYNHLETDKMLSQGVVIITVMIVATWQTIIQSMKTSSLAGTPDRILTYTPDKVSDNTGKKPLQLQPLNGDLFVDLVKLWLNEFYQKHNLVPPDPLYPFQKSDLLNYGKNKPTVREALEWCAKNFKAPEKPPLPSDPAARFQLALQAVRSSNQVKTLDTLEDSEASQTIGAALKFGFQTLIGETFTGQTPSGQPLNNVQIIAVEEITPKSKNSGWINFKLVGEENGQRFKLGVAVLEHTHGLSVGAGMQRLIDYDTFDLTRGCLVRSAEKKILKNWHSSGYLETLLQNGGEWADLKPQEIKPLLEFYFVNEQRENYGLSEQQAIDFSKPEIIQNPLLLEILSSPTAIIEDIIKLFDDDSDDEENGFTYIGGLFDTDDDDSDDDLTSEDEADIEEEDDDDDDNAANDNDNNTDVFALFEEEDYTGTKPQAFILAGQRYEVKSWKDVLVKTSEIIYPHHANDFDKVLQLMSKKKRPYFSRNPQELKAPSQIGNSQFYVDTNFNANQIVNLAKRVIALFGYAEDSLTIETRD